MGYAADVERLENELAALEGSEEAAHEDLERATTLAYRRYELGSLRGDLAEVETADLLVDDLLHRVGAWPDLCVLKATIDVKLHRVADVPARLDRVPGLAVSADGRRLLGDAAVQEGAWDEARELLRDASSWQDLVRLGELERLLGRYDEADRLYAEAEDELTAKQMRSYAWVEVQRGLLDVARGRHAEARAHYDVAERAYPGYWFVAEHVAALLVAEGRIEAGALLYETLVARPELLEALARVYEQLGRPDDARSCRDRALAVYLASVERGHVHYLHHLAELCEGRDAVHWAREDLRVRRGPQGRATLAWALHRNGEASAAADEMEKALASGLSGSTLARRAATVFAAAGRAR